MPTCILFACYKKSRVTPIRSLWLALMQEKAASASQVFEYLRVQWSALSVPGIQGRHFGAAWQYKDTRVWWDTDLPFPSSTVMPFTVEWWIDAPTSHIFAHARTWHTFRLVHMRTCKNVAATLLSGQQGSDIASHTQCHIRQTDILTVELHYSEPGVGGKGNKVVFISCSLGVL